MAESLFTKLYNTDVSKHIEKKGNFSYLSWAYAVKALREADPKASWEVKRFTNEDRAIAVPLPFLQTECGYFVEVAVTVDGVTLSQIHPVLDNRNHPIAKPNAFQINTSIQRCLVKAIALHGLGLHIYQGEDLPDNPESSNGRTPDFDSGNGGSTPSSGTNTITVEKLMEKIKEAKAFPHLKNIWEKYQDFIKAQPTKNRAMFDKAKNKRKAELEGICDNGPKKCGHVIDDGRGNMGCDINMEDCNHND